MAGTAAWQLGSGWVTVGPHSEVKGKNVSPGRIIWNIESNDVKGDFERMKAAGAIVIAEPYAFEAPPDATVSNTSIATLRRPRRQLLPAHEPDGDVGEAFTYGQSVR